MPPLPCHCTVPQQRRLELARAKASRGEAWQESDDEDDDDDGGGGGDYGSGGGVDDGGCEDHTPPDRKVDKMLWDTEGSGAGEAVGGGGSTAGIKAEVTAAEAVVKMEREAKASMALVTHKANIEKECVPPCASPWRRDLASRQ